MAEANLTAARLRELLCYDPETGIFTSRIDRIGKGCKVKKGDAVGGPHTKGYWDIRLDGRRYLAHRLAWLYVNGEWPENVIDHRDRNKRNNRWSNLRDVTQFLNMQNNNAKGVTFHTRDQKWIAQIVANGRYFSKRFDALDDAIAAREQMKLALHAPA